MEGGGALGTGELGGGGVWFIRDGRMGGGDMVY